MYKLADYLKGGVVPEWIMKVEGDDQNIFTFGTDVEVYGNEHERRIYPKTKDHYDYLYIVSGTGLNVEIAAPIPTVSLKYPKPD